MKGQCEEVKFQITRTTQIDTQKCEARKRKWNTWYKGGIYTQGGIQKSQPSPDV